MQLNVFQKGWNYSQDGPGNRLVYHLQGCNMRCPWCSNPEGLAMEGSLMVDKEKLLDEVCPYGAIKNGEVNRSMCETCEDKPCINQNRNQGIKLSYNAVPVEEIVEEIIDCRPLYHTGGGVTFSGGEATLQFEPLKEALKQATEAGIHTAIQTNGSHRRLPELFPYISTLMIDLKQTSPRLYKDALGVPIDNTLINVAKASWEHPEAWIRITVIPYFNDSVEDAKNFSLFLREKCKPQAHVELLWYHEYGAPKYVKSGIKYPMDGFSLDDNRIKAFRKVFNDYNIPIART